MLGSVPSLSHTFLEIDHEIISAVIFLLPLIEGGQLLHAVTCDSMGS